MIARWDRYITYNIEKTWNKLYKHRPDRTCLKPYLQYTFCRCYYRTSWHRETQLTCLDLLCSRGISPARDLLVECVCRPKTHGQLDSWTWGVFAFRFLKLLHSYNLCTFNNNGTIARRYVFIIQKVDLFVALGLMGVASHGALAPMAKAPRVALMYSKFFTAVVGLYSWGRMMKFNITADLIGCVEGR